MKTEQCFSLVSETWSPQVNGVTNTLNYLSEGLRARGHHLQIVRPAQTGEKTGLTLAQTTTELRVRGLPLPGYPQLQWGLPATAALRRLWQQQPPDAVYLVTEGPLGWSALRLARRMGIPVISGFHTRFDGYCGHYRLGFLQGSVASYLRWFHNHTRLTLAASQSHLRELQQLGIQPCALLGRGVDCQRFSPAHRDQALRQNWGVAEGELVLLHTGRLAAEKNLPLLVAAWQTLRRQQSLEGISLRLVIVGDGPQRCELQRQLPDALFTGMLEGEALARAYASADIFVFPSLSETFGNVVLEAMASGLAVCAFEHAAAGQHISDRISGCVADMADEGQFIDNLCWLVRDAQGRRSIRLHARHRACQLDWSQVVQRFESHLQQAACTALPASQLQPRLRPAARAPHD